MIKQNISVSKGERGILSHSIPEANRRRFAPRAVVGAASGAALTFTGSAFAGSPTYTPMADSSVWQSIVDGLVGEGVTLWMIVIPAAMVFLGIGLAFGIIRGFIRSGGR